MENKIPSFLQQNENVKFESTKTSNAKLSFLDKTIRNSANTIKTVYIQAENASNKNFIYKINPHVKLFALIYFAVILSVASKLLSQVFATCFILTLFFVARLNVIQIYKKIFLLTFIFGFLVIAPASLNIITPGNIIFPIISFHKATHFWIYSIPKEIGVTVEGLQVVGLIFFRVMNSISMAMLIIFTTSFPAFVKSFKIFGVPDTFLMIITLAYKYIFILTKTIEETYFALKSRLINHVQNKQLRKLIAGRIFFIFRRSQINYENTYLAMVSRGYNGKVILHSSKDFTLIDVIATIVVIAFGIGIIFI